MDKNMYVLEEADKADHSSGQDSDGGVFVKRVARNGVVLKFKVGKYGTIPSSNVLSHDPTFGKNKSTRGQLENIETNTVSLSKQSDVRNAEARNNAIPSLDSTIGVNNPDEEISRARMVNNSSKQDGEMMTVKSIAMDTCTAGINGTNSSSNAKVYSTGNHEASASENSCSSPSEEHICHQCGKRFQSIDSLYGHTGSHRRDEYKLIRTMLEQPCVTETSCTMIENQELKSIWQASQGLMKISMVSGQYPVHSTKAIDVTCSNNDISAVTAQMMEMADVLMNLSQTIREDEVVKAPAPTSAAVFMCTTCNKVFDSYQALGGHISNHNKQPKTRQPVDTAGNSEGSREQQTWKYLCNKCNERFPTGQSLGGHKRKHYFEEQHRTKRIIDANVKAPVSLPRYAMQASGAVLPVHDDLQSNPKRFDDTVNLQVAPKPYDAVQLLQTNNLNIETERCVLELYKLSLDDSNGEP